MIFRQLFDTQTSTFTYLLADEASGEAVLIDTVFEQHQRDLALVRELGLCLRYTLDTHVHADHVTGAWLMKQAAGSRIAMSGKAGAECCDLSLEHGDELAVGDLQIQVRATPGHTDSCLSFVLPQHKMVFTGDALLIRGAGRTDFQQGDAGRLFHSVREQLFSLADDFVVYPAHDYSGRCGSTIEEEKRFNPRLGGAVREQDFVVYMRNLGLPHPKQLDIAVPANMRCGQPDRETPADLPDWGPVVRTYAGVLQVEPEWVLAHADDLYLIDVRESEEVANSSIGSIPGSRFLPLSTLRERSSGVPSDKPVILVCPAGARSAMAAGILETAGIDRVANMRGGLLEWQGMGLPVEARE